MTADFPDGTRRVTHAGEAMIATSHPLASASGLRVLSEGGSAADAAIAACAVQCVADPLMTGIGGDCFALYAPAGGPVRALNGSGRAPAAADPEALIAAGLTEIPRRSPHAVTIPGALSAWALLHRDHGRLPFDRLLRDAIGYAADGYPVAPRVAWDWARNAAFIGEDPCAASVYLPGGAPPGAGSRHSQPALAHTLRRVAQEGVAGFYEGEAAASMVRFLQGIGGVQTEADFAAARDAAFWDSPISTLYRGYEVLECPPNGQGLAALMILRILDGFDLSPDLPPAARIHLHAEATKLAYHHRDALLADPAASAGLADKLLSDPVIAALRARIDPSRAGRPALWSEPEHRDTICLAVVDRDGNAISFINSIFNPFGSGLLDPGSGVLFHNRGCSFRLAGGHPNRLAPGKRPMHTIIPGMLRDRGEVIMPFGVMGGHYQAAGHAAFLSGMIDCGLDPQEAINQPRSFAFGGVLEVEAAIPAGVRADLGAMGHRTRLAPAPIGGAQAILIDRRQGVLLGGSDGRKDGLALGW
ncbi:gamma-glutamyltransferase family protein [Pseudogemmobacter humi]|uniref:Gamma-glutamyltransferase YwrD n=1 Tax=Pseudogemmobacter humi TaxID=2483812 RepID=A0A3P5XPH6_9RHOB|nr:gamma-glutamyltransferase family protein [Pseudogemmobacter humi]VDC33606.1 Putative gamma-glutamyltransferase YwrD [Pseudogemmobacter humi]